MVLELKTPEAPTFEGLKEVLPVFLAYLLSFAFVGIYWNNHHHLLRATKRVTASIMWANLHLLFWLSLIPFVTAWVGEYHEESLPAASYGFIAVMSAVAFTILVVTIKRGNPDTKIVEAIGNDIKGKASMVIYILGTALAFLNPWLGYSCFVVVSIIWFIPDRRLS